MPTERRKRILLVDDDPHILATLGDYLAFVGYDVVRAASGREALQRLHADVVDLVLLDIMMPGIDGGDVAQVIASTPSLKRLPTIYLTAAVSRREVREHHGVIGGQPVIAKPVDLDELDQRIRQALAASAPPKPPA